MYNRTTIIWTRNYRLACRVVEICNKKDFLFTIDFPKATFPLFPYKIEKI